MHLHILIPQPFCPNDFPFSLYKLNDPDKNQRLLCESPYYLGGDMEEEDGSDERDREDDDYEGVTEGY